MDNDDDTRLNQRQRRAIIWGASIILAICLGGFVPIWLYGFWRAWQPELIKDHFAAVVGLPAAAFCASCIVLTFSRQSETHQIKFAILGLTLEGAASQVVLWTLCFLGITLAIWLLW